MQKTTKNSEWLAERAVSAVAAVMTRVIRWIKNHPTTMSGLIVTADRN